MRRLLLIDRPVDDEAMADAVACGASEIVHCPEGVPPAALSSLTMGYHEIEEPVSEPTAVIQVSIVADRLAGLGLTQEQIEAVTAPWRASSRPAPSAGLSPHRRSP